MCRAHRVFASTLAGAFLALPFFGQGSVAIGDGAVELVESGQQATLDAAALFLEGPGSYSALLLATGIGFADDSEVGTMMTAGGIVFDDTSYQSSAAYTKAETDSLVASLAPVPSWPMVCKTTPLDGVLVPSPDTSSILFCRSPQSGVPGGTIGSGEGVPSGHYFLVTGVLARCAPASDCEEVFFRVTRRNVANPTTDLETWVFPLSGLVGSAQTMVAEQFGAPLMILGEGDYLVGLASLSSSGGHTVWAQVTGYLTESPESVRP